MKMKNGGLIVILIVIFIAVIAGTSGDSPSTDNTGGNRVGDVAANFTVKDFDGDIVKLSDFKGKPVFLNFWASWCPFCVAEMPLMARFQEEFGDEYVTLAINRGESLFTARTFAQDLGVEDVFTIALDESDHIYQRTYGAQGMPYSVFIDKEGIIRSIVRGSVYEESLRENIELILN